jgi:hypothetical protein
MQCTHDLRKRVAVAAGVLAVALATTRMQAQTLPPTPPTTLPGQTTTTPAAPGTETPPPNPPHHAEVLYANGQLQVRADNSSLNQILRSISHTTGLKITGGVEEQRVFGNYGPGPMSAVLATLLDGTGTNILLLGGDPQNQPELVLTPRNGGPEPPGPNSETYAMYDDSSDRNTPVPPPAPHNPNAPAQPSVIAVHPPDPAPSPSITGSPTAKNAPKILTPEIVAQELLQMQAQQNLRKQQLDKTIQQEQLDQKKRLEKKQNQSSQPTSPTPKPTNSTPQQ